ncbi:hypothetical protein N0V84_007617 [Fusarium piperis]|uniref:Uncharacterized protein n=1 Tax=Fusarium piperis TaxID=1435070 RepID=A0A9W9BL76_9HYPO|nr:hypothetical protein N0V84_007617 [Fusarium piperis]
MSTPISINCEAPQHVVYKDTSSTYKEPRHRQPEDHDRLIPSPSLLSDLKHQNLRQHWCKRIGLASIAAIVFGTAVILASLAILVFLWQGAQLAERRQEPVFWQTIVFHGWAPQVVTICSAAIRIAMSLQNGFVVAAVAAIMLETSGASLVDTAMLSVERALGSTPLNLLPPALRRCATREDGITAILHLTMVAAALVIGLASTFTSTILLSDFRSNLIASPSVTTEVGVDFVVQEEYRYLGKFVIESRPVANWRFAEARDGEGATAKGDTGDTYRAMLPFQDAESRRLLEFYSGPAAVTNFRTICVAPDLQNLTLAQDPNTTGGRGVRVHADAPPSLDWKLKFEPFTGASMPSPVDAQLLDTWYSSSPSSWPLTLYYSLDDTFTSEGSSNPTHWPYLLFRAFLLNSTMLLNETKTDGDDLPETLRNLTTKKQGLWTRAINTHGVEVFSATECYFNNAGPRLYNVTMSGRGISSEPTGDWRRGPGHENQTGILHQMGVGATFEHRGILELAMDSPEAYKPYNRPFAPMALETSATSSDLVTQFSWAFSDSWKTTTAMGSMKLPHPAHSSVFQNIIQQTEDPARAVQAMMTRLYQMQYYDFLPDFDFKQATETIYSTERLIPSRWIGLLVVFFLVAVHLLLVSIATALFIFRTRGSALGNIWQAVSQMASPETRQILESTDSKRDDEVKACIKAMGKDVGVYGLSRSVESGRIEIQLRERRKEIMDP